jgi:predicted transcriptional regulator
MNRRKASELIRTIIRIIGDQELSLRAIETKANTSDKSVKDYVELLQDLGITKIKHIKKGKKTISRVKLTKQGKKTL